MGTTDDGSVSDQTSTGAGAQDLEAAAAQFDRVRRRLFGIAYRMLGSGSDAEDVVQEVWIRWQAYDRSAVLEPAAVLAKTATRLSINHLKTARARHETYVGPWLPEPVDTSQDPTLGAERGEALNLAIVLLLEKLTPTERAAYVLREAFDYPYSQIAEIVQVSEGASRQLVSRARKHLQQERRARVETGEQRRLLDAFLAAAQAGDVVALEELFAADVVSYTDGNGTRLAARIPVVGRQRVASFITAFSSHFWAGKVIEVVELNGQPAAQLVQGGVVTTSIVLVSSAEGVRQVQWVMSPAKLARLTARG